MALDVMEKSRLELSRGRQKEVIPEVMMSNPHTGMIRIPCMEPNYSEAFRNVHFIKKN